jgi:hypothetical protein
MLPEIDGRATGLEDSSSTPCSGHGLAILQVEALRLKRLIASGNVFAGSGEGVATVTGYKRKWGRAVSVAAALLMVGCAAQRTPGAVEVTSQAAAGMAISKFRTYAWKTPGVRAADPTRMSELEQRDWLIRNAVEEELRARGLIARSNEPDLLVDYRTEFKFKHPESFQDYNEYRRLGGTVNPGEANVFGYQEGTLSVFLLEQASGALLWKGVGRGVAWEAQDPSHRLREAIRQIFTQLPG